MMILWLRWIWMISMVLKRPYCYAVRGFGGNRLYDLGPIFYCDFVWKMLGGFEKMC